MIRRLLLLLALLCTAQQANAQSSTLGNLPSGGAIAGTDLFYDVQTIGVGGVKVTAAQLATFFQANIPPLVLGTNLVEQLNGVNAQTLRVYNTFASTTNYERGTFDWNNVANVLSIGTEKGSGGGSVRNMEFIIGGTNKMDYGVTNAGFWSMPGNSTGLNVGNSSFIVNSAVGLFSFVLNTEIQINASAGGGIVVGLNNYYGFGSTSFSTTADTGLGRNAAGVVEVNSGTLGTVNGSIKPANFISGGSVPVDGGGSCTASSFAGGATAGTFSAPACAAGTIAITFAFSAPTGWSCDATDRTTAADSVKQTATTATKATFAATTAASDVIQYKCTAY
jgi:hypothetical protein